MVQKLGFRGFPDFQARLHQELEATISNPIAKHDRWAASAPGTHTLNRFADAIMGNMRQTLSQIEPAEFDTAAALVADLKRKVYLVGGRITRSIADYLFTHLQVIRTGVTQIAANPSSWPHYVLDMKAGDVLILFDIRRYEQEMETLARFARNRGVEIILFTDSGALPSPSLRPRSSAPGSRFPRPGTVRSCCSSSWRRWSRPCRARTGMKPGAG